EQRRLPEERLLRIARRVLKRLELQIARDAHAVPDFRGPVAHLSEVVFDVLRRLLLRQVDEKHAVRRAREPRQALELLRDDARLLLLEGREHGDALLERFEVVLVELERVLLLLGRVLAAPEQVVLPCQAIEIRDEARDALRFERAGAALLGDRVALGGETAELHGRVADRDQQRQRHEREAHERKPEQRSWSPESHLA